MEEVLAPEQLIEKAASKKRNSFSKNLLLSYKDTILDYLSSNGVEGRLEFLRKISFTYYGQDISESLACILWAYRNLTIHAIDEKEAPIPFSVLEDLYKDNVFVLQYLKEKKALALLINDVKQTYYEEPNGSLITYDGELERKLIETFHSSWNYTKFDISASYTAKHIEASYLDFGFLKSAMSLRKTYGIQDLLEIGLSMFKQQRKIVADKASSNGLISPDLTTCRILFSLDFPKFSTITLFSSSDMLTLQGKTKMVEEKWVSKISLAIKIFLACNRNRMKLIGEE